MNLSIFSVLMISLLVTACGKSSSSNKTTTSIKTINGLSTSAMDGKLYEAKCVPLENEKELKADHQFRIYKEAGLTHFEWSVWFMTKNCQTAILEMNLKGYGIFTDSTFKQLNNTLKNAVVMPLQYAATTEFNKNRFCGLGDWKTYDWKDILYSDCMKRDDGTLFFDQQGSEFVLYNCNENEELNEKCTRVRLKPIKMK
ncbi:hypothetical protein ACJVC5_02000 [Peredibacter sp. HCB2-198]|uniref:hypothetical protein n=1 Tax=Peredibacter sp. HCB2-198 TaxID=3383025 RepID=UPI0038B46F2A